LSTAYAPGPRPRCPHCEKNYACPRRRGLCQRCYGDPEVRALYPSRVPRGAGATPGPRPVAPPDAPTDAPPGSEAKVLVLAGRAARRQGLWHPDDAPMGREPSLYDEACGPADRVVRALAS
jgi:hypothetical protein